MEVSRINAANAARARLMQIITPGCRAGSLDQKYFSGIFKRLRLRIDRRWQRRHAAKLKPHFVSGHRDGDSLCCNAASGAFIVTREMLAVGTPLKLIFAMIEGELKIEAVVRNSTAGRGMGVEFVSIGGEELAIILKALKRSDLG